MLPVSANCLYVTTPRNCNGAYVPTGTGLWSHRSYAMAVVELLDPGGTLFGPRIIAQGKSDAAAVLDLGKRLKVWLPFPLTCVCPAAR